ncbi:MAG: hypothetical protein ACFB3T_08865 [Geminicoccaceae bacterium]
MDVLLVLRDDESPAAVQVRCRLDQMIDERLIGLPGLERCHMALGDHTHDKALAFRSRVLMLDLRGAPAPGPGRPAQGHQPPPGAPLCRDWAIADDADPAKLADTVFARLVSDLRACGVLAMSV